MLPSLAQLAVHRKCCEAVPQAHTTSGSRAACGGVSHVVFLLYAQHVLPPKLLDRKLKGDTLSDRSFLGRTGLTSQRCLTMQNHTGSPLYSSCQKALNGWYPICKRPYCYCYHPCYQQWLNATKRLQLFLSRPNTSHTSSMKWNYWSVWSHSGPYIICLHAPEPELAEVFHIWQEGGKGLVVLSFPLALLKKVKNSCCDVILHNQI